MKIRLKGAAEGAALVQASARRIQHADHGHPHLARKADDGCNFGRVALPCAPRHDREVSRVAADLATVDLSVTGDHAVCGGKTLLHAEPLVLRAHQLPDLHEGILLEETLDALPGRELVPSMLLFHGRLATHGGDLGLPPTKPFEEATYGPLLRLDGIHLNLPPPAPTAAGSDRRLSRSGPS